ncbi:MAG: hypothetical protein PWQ29_125 [Verrucomicrobiota bacterium]|jgi:primosomal protein N' (replication factor Y)|nr:hypothetical protein [Verrucomicrobiota bacterium]MDK2962731.1 hypothetical protein [Verrucomicrobiota bacterium]
MNRIAKVAVDLSLDREFDYLIPDSLQDTVEIGSRVEVPFGPRDVTGFVVGLTDKSAFDSLKPIGRVLGEKSLITEPVMELARWMSAYYLAPFETCVRAVLPAVVRHKARGEKKQLTVSLNTSVAAASLPLGTEAGSLCHAESAPVNFFDPKEPIAHLKGTLPHWRQDGTTYFVTFQLADSIPQEKLKQWKKEKKQWFENHPEPHDENTRKEYGRLFPDRLQNWLDAGYGSCRLGDERAKSIVESAFRKFDGERYRLHEFVVMPNHVHVLVSPLGDRLLSDILHSWKSHTATELNRLAGTSGAVWQKESFNHIVRSPEQITLIRKYIQDNPKQCGSGLPAAVSRGGEPLPPLTPKQQAVVQCLESSGPLLLSELTAAAGVTAAPVKTLAKKGVVTISNESVYRDPHAGIELLKTDPLPLMPQQAAALKQIVEAMEEPEPQVLLLHGVTGSGKTEVYLQAIAHALEQGQGAIVLVPEIALTPQTVDHFRARFADRPERVAVLHSSLSDGERYDEWHRIRSGEAQIVVGARSALFAPIRNLGLIAVDEEHEPTYKQDETPRYNARDMAVLRGRLEKCTVVLGSATPSLESVDNAKSGKYRYVNMPIRVDDRRMPQMRIIDMRIEAQREGRPHLFSRELIEAIRTRIDRAEQTIIFLNRRGFSASLVCPECGYTAECGQCSVGMTYHKARARLVCHLCGDEKPVPARCPACQSPQFRYAGAGTEKIEEVMAKLFPKARIARMDSDSMRRKNAHRDLLSQFRIGKIDILVGTQMIAKGLDFPNVTLVGVVNPDHALHMADFRAGERVFQLLTQVAGRAGRGETEGEVIVQTYTPHHPAIQAARRMDFEGFCDQETSFRKELGYPPCTHLTCITLRGKDETAVEQTAEKFFRFLEKCAQGNLLLSPAMPAPIARIRGEYRWQILLRATRVRTMNETIRSAFGLMKWPKTIKVTVDVDASSLL